LFLFKNNSGKKYQQTKTVSENHKTYKIRRTKEIDVEEEEVKERARAELCVRSSHKMKTIIEPSKFVYRVISPHVNEVKKRLLCNPNTSRRDETIPFESPIPLF
jgi:hypothetical protein